jgi:hypothetical protein
MFADELGVLFGDVECGMVCQLEGFLTWSPRDPSPCEPAQLLSLRLLNRLPTFAFGRC